MPEESTEIDAAIHWKVGIPNFGVCRDIGRRDIREKTRRSNNRDEGKKFVHIAMNILLTKLWIGEKEFVGLFMHLSGIICQGIHSHADDTYCLGKLEERRGPYTIQSELSKAHLSKAQVM